MLLLDHNSQIKQRCKNINWVKYYLLICIMSLCGFSSHNTSAVPGLLVIFWIMSTNHVKFECILIVEKNDKTL